MAPATRGKRAAQSPPTDAEPAPAKQPRKTNGRGTAKVEPVDEDQLANSEPEEKKPAPRKGRSKAAVKAEPEDDEQDDAAEAKPAPKKGKAKAVAPKADSAELEDKKPAPKKPAPKKAAAKKPAPAATPSSRPSRNRKAPERFEEFEEKPTPKAAPTKKGSSKVFDPIYITTNSSSRLVKADIYVSLRTSLTTHKSNSSHIAAHAS